jgi:hypothetical protein
MPNYSIIDAQILSTATSSITFSSIPSTYTDLVIICHVKSSAAANTTTLLTQVNGQTGNYYSGWFMRNSASTGSSGRYTTYINPTYAGPIGTMVANSVNSNLYSAHKIDLVDYKTTGHYKTFMARSTWAYSDSAGGQEHAVQMYYDTIAVSSIKLFPESGNFVAGSTFYLYGITAAGSPKATGGIVSTDGAYWYHTFGATQTFTPTASLTADILTIAGGGQGGGGNGAGGGAGGLVYLSSQSLTAQNYTITIGAGGSGGVTNNIGGSGSNSQFGSLTAAIGGGGGGGFDANSTGANGGSGGGGGSYSSSSASLGGGTGSQGGNGGSGNTANLGNYPYHSGGGGGAGGAGANATNLVCGNGGIGSSTYSSWGLATKTGQLSSGTYYYAGGGGGGGDKGSGTTTFGTGGFGGGGVGGSPQGDAAKGLANTGGGGGGEGGGGAGATGGSGIVIVRYPIG